METFIPIIIALVVFAFQAYANFQKEQEKAKKRNLGQPPLPPLPEDNAGRPFTGYEDDRAPAPAPSMADRQQPDVSRRPLFDAYSGVVEEVKRARKSSQRPVIPQRLAVKEDTYSQSPMEVSEFDLRDAVIKSAILERPYQ